MVVWHDVSDGVLEVSFQDTFDVARRLDNVDQKGRTNISEQLFPRVQGVVTPTGDNDLKRLREDQRAGKSILVVTNFRLQGPAPGMQPDAVAWPSGSSERFVVAHLEDFSRYGQGFVSAICVDMSVVQAPPTPQ